MGSQSFTSPGSYLWTCPVGVHSVTVECWGHGGKGGDGGSDFAGGGGGGGAYAKVVATVTPGTNYTAVVGAYGFVTTFNASTCVADFGLDGAAGGGPGAGQAAGGPGGLAANCIGSTIAAGADGSAGAGLFGGISYTGNGGNAGGLGGGAGGNAANQEPMGAQAGGAPGGGGGGGTFTDTGPLYSAGGPGTSGEVLLTWLDPSIGSGTSHVSVATAGTAGLRISPTGASTITVASSGTAVSRFTTGASTVSAGSAGSAFSFSGTGASSTRIASSGAVSVVSYGTGSSAVSVESSGTTPLLHYGYYLNLFTSEYRSSANMRAWLLASIQLFQDELACAELFQSAFSVDSAIGAQLDTLGLLVGASRTVAFQPSGGVSPVLDDDTFRVLIRALIAQNHWDGTMDGLLRAWQLIFPGGLLIVNDHQNMTVDLYVAAPMTSILQDLVLNGYIVPRPEGVLYNFSIATLPMLGFDRGDAYVAGVDTGHFT